MNDSMPRAVWHIDTQLAGDSPAMDEIRQQLTEYYHTEHGVVPGTSTPSAVAYYNQTMNKDLDENSSTPQ